MVWGSLGAAVVIYTLWSVFLHPEAPMISQVQKLPPPKPPKIKISIETLRDVACLQAADVLYPPCTMAKASVFSLTPMYTPHNTIMDFGITDYESGDSDETESD